MSISVIGKLKEQRAKLVEGQRAALDAAEAENRGLNDTEQSTYEARDAELDKLEPRIEQLEKQVEREFRLAASRGARKGSGERGGEGGETGEQPAERTKREYSNYLIRGRIDMDQVEYRNLQQTLDVQAGYLIAPQDFRAELIVGADNVSHMRRRSTVKTVAGAHTLGFPQRTANPADATWTSELVTADNDTTLAYGKREFTPHRLTKSIRVSLDLIANSAINAVGEVSDRFGYVVGITQEQAFQTGSGAGQPLGVFAANAQGISTGRDVSTGNTTTAITFDGLIEAKYSVVSNYYPNASWMFHRTAVKNIRKLKDGEGQYIWQASVTAGRPDTILGHQVDQSEYTPSTFTTGLYVGAFGDFRNYWIADSNQMTLQRLDELYAATNQVGFINRSATDGMPVVEAAFARVTLA